MKHRQTLKTIYCVGLALLLAPVLMIASFAAEEAEETADIPEAVVLTWSTKAEITDPTLEMERRRTVDPVYEKTISVTTMLVEDGDVIAERTAEFISYTATFGTQFYLKFIPEVGQYIEGTVVPSTAYRRAMNGGGGSGSGAASGSGAGDGLRIGDEGMNFEPPLIAALICGGGYLACSSLFKAGIFRYDRKVRR